MSHISTERFSDRLSAAAALSALRGSAVTIPDRVIPRGRRPAGDRSSPAATQPQVPASGGGIAFGGDNHGIASTGAHAVNTLIQVRVTQDAAVLEAVAELEVREIPFLSTFAEARPVGRSRVIGQWPPGWPAGMSVQLYGAPGVGKKAIAQAVIRQLGTRPTGVRGFELLPAGGQPHTLDSLYERPCQQRSDHNNHRGQNRPPPKTSCFENSGFIWARISSSRGNLI